ncbi:MAG TPA: hypothetical protein VF490_20550 [Chryseosolibacter sp.]
MKKTTITLVTCFCCIGVCFSQDVITTTNGEDIQAKILKVGTDEIEYKKSDNPDGPVFTMSKSEVRSIVYENGTQDVFGDRPQQPRFSNDLFMKGQADAMVHYQGYTGAGTGTLLVALVSPLAGLVPAIACSSTPPKDQNLTFPSPELRSRPEYYEGYKMQAKKIKKGKVWKNWGIALGINFMAVLIIMSGQSN